MPTRARPRTIPPIADSNVIDLANRRAATKSRPRLEVSEPSGTLGAMPETTGFFNCPECDNGKFMVWRAGSWPNFRFRIYCDDYGCDWSTEYLVAVSKSL